MSSLYRLSGQQKLPSIPVETGLSKPETTTPFTLVGGHVVGTATLATLLPFETTARGLSERHGARSLAIAGASDQILDHKIVTHVLTWGAACDDAGPRGQGHRRSGAVQGSPPPEQAAETNWAATLVKSTHR